MFLDQDERLLLFHHRQGPLSLDVLKGFRDAGIKTIKHAARQISWHEIEPTPGVYNWKAVDECIELSHQADLKVMLDVYWRAPDWINAKREWVRTAGTTFIDPDGIFDVSWLAVNPFDSKSMDQEEKFLHKICERYSPDVLCCYAMPHSGERILPFFSNPYTEEQCVDTVLRRQKVFAEYYDELWTHFHPWAADPRIEAVDRSTPTWNGNEHMEAVHDVIIETFPEHTLNNFITVFFADAGPFKLPTREWFKIWTGAQFTVGVVPNSRAIDTYGIHGLIMASSGINPQYQFGEPSTLEFDRTRKAIEILKR